jgi:hypothetical protein
MSKVTRMVDEMMDGRSAGLQAGGLEEYGLRLSKYLKMCLDLLARSPGIFGQKEFLPRMTACLRRRNRIPDSHFSLRAELIAPAEGPRLQLRMALAD